eukprot:COSAG02_NODE_59583_length_274_cov_0.554286_1_plen_38_part_01
MQNNTIASLGHQQLFVGKGCHAVANIWTRYATKVRTRY